MASAVFRWVRFKSSQFRREYPALGAMGTNSPVDRLTVSGLSLITLRMKDKRFGRTYFGH